MAIQLVARVRLDDMEPTVIYPREGVSPERIALLTGIIQLVSAALERSKASSTECAPNFMKSERGVIGYCQMEPYLIICEGDAESETEEAMRAVASGLDGSVDEIASRIEKTVKKRTREIGDLWR